MALVLCFSFGAMAADPNQYTIDSKISGEGITAADGTLLIQTVGAYKASHPGEKTFFINGEALSDDDIILANDKVGAVFAVGTRNPWGYPAGSILDAGYMKNGKPARDTVWAIEFLANRWDSWAPENCGNVKFDLVNYDFNVGKEVETGGLQAVRVTREYKIKADFSVVTYYGAAPGESYLYIYNQMTNNGDAKTLKNSFAITNKGDDGGFMKNIDGTFSTGTYGNKEGQTYSTFIATPEYSPEYTNPGFKSYYKGSLGYKELVVEHEYAKDETVLLKQFAIINDTPSTVGLNAFLHEWKNISETFTVSGTVKDAEGKAVSDPVIVVEKGDKTYGWYIGDDKGAFSFELPKADDYKVFVERNGYGAGAEVEIDKDNAADLKLTSGGKKVKVAFNLKDKNGNPVYGKVQINDAYPTVRFCGDSVYNAKEKGKVETEIAPGEYTAAVYGEGFWFYSNPVEVKADTKDGDRDVTIDMVYSAGKGWLCGDMHHHANKNDAFADPADAIPALCASGLDVGFITDHDFTVNNKKAYDLAMQYGMTGFVPSEEISCSWAHFNVIPLDKASYEYFRDDSQENHVMNQFGELPAFVKQTHDHGAAITANHPWYSYGLYYANYVDAIPGGYTDEYDNIEINSCSSDSENLETILSGLANWTAYMDGAAIYKDKNGKDVVTEKAHYILGGSDTHDVLYPGFGDKNYKNTLRSATDYVSGKVRTYAYVGDVTDSIIDNGLNFSKAVVDGNSYTSYGPLLEMDKIPGENSEEVVQGVFTVKLKVKSLDGIKDILVLKDGATDPYEGFGKSQYTEEMLCYDKAASMMDINEKTYDFEAKVDIPAGKCSWVAFVVVDVNGCFAITNPYWVANTFPDIDFDDWFFKAIVKLQGAGLINGYPDGTFGPEGNITRAEFATMIFNYRGGKDAKTEGTPKKFSDVGENFWGKAAIDYLSAEGILDGYPDGTFCPNKTISRAEMAQIIYKMSGYDKFVKTFSDVAPGSWYYNAVTTLHSLGIVNGMTEDKFVPENTATRAQAGQIMYNVMLFVAE